MDDFDDQPEPVNLSVWVAPICALLVSCFAFGAWIGAQFWPHVIWKP
jgi:hypothetical protein